MLNVRQTAALGGASLKRCHDRCQLLSIDCGGASTTPAATSRRCEAGSDPLLRQRSLELGQGTEDME